MYACMHTCIHVSYMHAMDYIYIYIAVLTNAHVDFFYQAKHEQAPCTLVGICCGLFVCLFSRCICHSVC